MKNNKNTNKGITLIALVITIIVLLILAGVSIAMLTGENGILTQANTAEETTNEMNAEEAIQMETAGAFNDEGKYSVTKAKENLEKNLNIPIDDITDNEDGTLKVEYKGYEFRVYRNGQVILYETKTFEEVKNSSYVDKNTIVEDDYNNTFILPEGFKVRVDETTNNADTVNEGIVIEDQKGNQFVWIPVGTFNKTADGTQTETVNLGRYSFASNGKESAYTGSFTEDTNANHDSRYGNAIAKDIDDFINSANSNHGYYIGRYEAGVVNGILNTSAMLNSYTAPDSVWTGYVAQEGKSLELVCKSGQQVWNYVTQNKASELAQGMYTGKAYESDLINSYAWDTAIVFIQKCSGDPDYSKQNRLQTTLAKTGEATDGTNNDVRCNIFDMAGNVWEWATETYKDFTFPCVIRACDYGYSGYYTDTRRKDMVVIANKYGCFRPILYL